MKMLKVYQAYDRTQIAEIPMDDRESLVRWNLEERIWQF